MIYFNTDITRIVIVVMNLDEYTMWGIVTRYHLHEVILLDEISYEWFSSFIDILLDVFRRYFVRIVECRRKYIPKNNVSPSNISQGVSYVLSFIHHSAPMLIKNTIASLSLSNHYDALQIRSRFHFLARKKPTFNLEMFFSVGGLILL